MYFMFVIRKLIVDPIFNEIRMPGKGYLKASVSGIFWDAISKISKTKFGHWKEIANNDLSIFSYKIYKTELIDLKTIVFHIIQKSDIVRKGLGWGGGKEGYKVFVDAGDGNAANSTLFKYCNNLNYYCYSFSLFCCCQLAKYFCI